MTIHYVDNKRLYAAIQQYKQDLLVSKEQGVTKPRIPEYVGECILLIAQRLSTKPSFLNYSYREEMISDGIENCISYFDNFDPNLSSNPFAYFTQIIYYAFLRRIKKEKKQVYVKYKIAEFNLLFSEFVEQGEDNEFGANMVDFDSENVSEFIKTFEEGIGRDKVKRKKGIDLFIEEDETLTTSDEVLIGDDIFSLEMDKKC